MVGQIRSTAVDTVTPLSTRRWRCNLELDVGSRHLRGTWAGVVYCGGSRERVIQAQKV